MRLVIFDLDGTLLDSAPDLCAAMNTVLTEAGKDTIEYDRCRLLIGNGIRALVKRSLEIDGSRYSDEELEPWLQRYYDLYRSTMTEKSRLYDQAEETLSDLRQQGYTLALCTNKYMSLTMPLLAHYQLDSYFDMVVAGDSTAKKKPDPQPLHYCCQQLGIAEQESIMVGDSINDIRSAQAAGITSMLITWGYRTQNVEELAPDYVIDGLDQIKPILAQQSGK